MHSTRAPSSAARWVECPASVGLAAQFPEERTAASDEGDVAHHVASERLAGRFVPVGGEVTPEMVWGASLYHDAVTYHGDTGMLIEQRIDITAIHPECFGTPDAARRDGKTLYVFDYKYGFVPVEVELNYQMICYAVGLLARYGMLDLETRIVFCIVQPRAPHPDGPVRRWTCMASELRGEINRLIQSADEAGRDDARCVAGLHCVTTYCPARGSCAAFQRMAAGVLTFTGSATVRPMEAAGAGAELKMLQAAKAVLESLISARTAEVENHLTEGRHTGWAKEPTFGRDTWAIPTAEIENLGAMLGVKLMKDPEPVTPVQAAKLAGVNRAMLEKFFHKPSRGLKLVPSDTLDKRAAKAFGDSNNG